MQCTQGSLGDKPVIIAIQLLAPSSGMTDIVTTWLPADRNLLTSCYDQADMGGWIPFLTFLLPLFPFTPVQLAK